LLMPIPNTATPFSLAGHNVNYRDTDAPLSGRIRLRVHRNVRLANALFPFLLCTHYRYCPCRMSDTTHHDARSISNTKRAAAIHVTLDKAVCMDVTDERYLGSQSSERDSRIGMDGQRCDSGSRSGLATDRELESGMEKSIQ
jgi:hypothetical protein